MQSINGEKASAAAPNMSGNLAPIDGYERSSAISEIAGWENQRGRTNCPYAPSFQGVQTALRNGLTSIRRLRMGSVPNRTSYELHLPAEMSAWYSAVELADPWRTISGRSADG
jgi:hypothetical protein